MSPLDQLLISISDFPTIARDGKAGAGSRTPYSESFPCFPYFSISRKSLTE